MGAKLNRMIMSFRDKVFAVNFLSRMTATRERTLIRALHLILSIPIVGYLYGPVASIPQAAQFTRWIAMPTVVLSGFWLWLKPKIIRHLQQRRLKRGQTRDRLSVLNGKSF